MMTAIPPDLNHRGASRLMQTTCPYCGVGCGVDVMKNCDKEKPLSQLQGTPEHPANFGRLCIKGTHLLETLAPEKRLLVPRINGEDASWDEAIEKVASTLSSTLASHGPEAVALYGSGQLLTEDYYVANKFMKGFIGSANIDTNSRLCMSSAVAAYKRAFGEDIVPCDYTDLECTDLLIITGSNAAWTHPVLFQRIERAKLKNPDMKVIVIDPRRTDTSSLADLHIALKPGTDAALFCGLLRFIANTDALNKEFIDRHTSGFDEALNAADTWTVSAVAECCDVPEGQLTAFFTLFCNLPRAVTFFSMGINQSTSGVDKGNAIINCHLATAKIGREGCGPFSITGQPNAMGGREVGGLSNMLAAHMDIENPDHHELVKTFWNAPSLVTRAGLKAVDMFRAAAEGKVKVIWIMATNPVASMPDRELVEAALRHCDTVIVSDTAASNDTMAFADIVLPATGWSEKNGTVTNSERRISRQRGLLAPSGQARHDWDIISQVARKMGFNDAFAYSHPSEIFSEHCRLTATKNDNDRALNLAPLSALTAAQYDNLKPAQWPFTETQMQGEKRLFADGRFYTGDKKARFISIVPSLPEQKISKDYPYILNTGRVRDQWHTMTRTGNTSRLLKHIDRPWLSMHPEDVAKLGLQARQLVALNASCSSTDSVLLPVKVDSNQRQGEVFAPIHWSATWGTHAKIGALLNGAHDPLSGQPELKHGAINIAPATVGTYGIIYGVPKSVAVLREKWHYWLTIPAEQGTMLDVADPRSVSDMSAGLIAVCGDGLECSTRQEADKSTLLFARKGKADVIVLMSSSPLDLPLEWLEAFFASGDALTPDQIHGLLNHQPDASFLSGPLVCSCFSVREKTIQASIRAGCDSVEKLGHNLKCGTNCGSCKPELSRLIEAEILTVTTV